MFQSCTMFFEHTTSVCVYVYIAHIYRYVVKEYCDLNM